MISVSSRFTIQHYRRILLGQQWYPEQASHPSPHLHCPETASQTDGPKETHRNSAWYWQRLNWAGVWGWVLLWVNWVLSSMSLQYLPSLFQGMEITTRHLPNTGNCQRSITFCQCYQPKASHSLFCTKWTTCAVLLGKNGSCWPLEGKDNLTGHVAPAEAFMILCFLSIDKRFFPLLLTHAWIDSGTEGW